MHTINKLFSQLPANKATQCTPCFLQKPTFCGKIDTIHIPVQVNSVPCNQHTEGHQRALTCIFLCYCDVYCANFFNILFFLFAFCCFGFFFGLFSLFSFSLPRRKCQAVPRRCACAWIKVLAGNRGIDTALCMPV